MNFSAFFIKKCFFSFLIKGFVSFKFLEKRKKGMEKNKNSLVFHFYLIKESKKEKEIFWMGLI